MGGAFLITSLWQRQKTWLKVWCAMEIAMGSTREESNYDPG